jgi:hypothetical protein
VQGHLSCSPPTRTPSPHSREGLNNDNDSQFGTVLLITPEEGLLAISTWWVFRKGQRHPLILANLVEMTP